MIRFRYPAHVAFVRRSVRRLGVADDAADDVVQSVLLVVFRRLPEFEGRSSLKTWIYEIVVRVVHGYWRSVRRRGTPGMLVADAVDPCSLPAPADQRPDALLSGATTARLVRELLDELEEDKREVLVLAELEGVSLREIAEVLHLPVGTVASRLRAARAAFERAARRRRAADERAALADLRRETRGAARTAVGRAQKGASPVM
jgi:RNA polymerase sigma-70 factor (ECF subfamily)